MKKWQYKLNVIDFIALGSGICLTIAYLVLKGSFKQDSPWLDIWPNISTEIIGIWVSVRVIDELIQKREKKRSTRESIIGGFNYFLDNARQLKPEYYDWRVQNLLVELEWFQKKFDKRKKHLFSDEIEIAQKIISIEKKITEESQLYTKNRNRLQILRTDYSSTFNKAGEIRSDVEKELRNLDYEKRRDSSIELPEFTTLIAGKENYFSENEVVALTASYKVLETYVNKDEHKSYERTEWHEIISSLHRGNSFKLMETEYDKLRDIWDYPEQSAINTIVEIENSNDFKNYPKILLGISQEFSTIVKILAKLRTDTEKDIDQLDELIKEFTENVLEESDSE